jgi:hypothetical protein
MAIWPNYPSNLPTLPEYQEILKIPTNLSYFRAVVFKIHQKHVDEIKGIN